MRYVTACGLAIVCGLAAGAAGLRAQAPATPAAPSSSPMTKRPALIPWPSSVDMGATGSFAITKDTVIEVTPGQPDLWRHATWLAALVRPALDGVTIAIRDTGPAPAAGAIRLEVVQGSATLGGDAYELAVTPTGARIAAATTAGVFYGLQTFRQLLPWKVEYRGPRPFEVTLPAARISDRPRFEWRGVFLDVSRHFFSVDEVKRYIDLAAMYKMNRIHLHLSDDQGWRIQIDSWPNLTRYGGSTEVVGGPGGYYTKADYAAIVAYAAERHMLLIPEIDMPSHCNAALASYPELNCDGVAPPLYTGIEVGFSNFCFEKEITFKFIDDVIRELAAMTPGPYIHVGGDEVKKMTPAQYSTFMERAQAIVERHGKTTIAWDEIIHGTMRPSTVVQYWRPDASLAPPPGTKLILSPANRIYLDMKYDDSAVLGQNWAGNVDVHVPYEWDPAGHLKVPESQILGVEAAIWSETPADIRDLEFLLFPRMPAVAELAWTAQSARDWNEFKVRLGAQAPRWSALGINAYWSPKIDWVR
jgi:hexosaminidase